MKLLTADDILQASDLPKQLVDVPEWGGSVYVRALSGSERDSYEASIVGTRTDNKQLNLNNIRARLCALTICDEAGKRLFSDAQINALGNKSAAALQRIYDVARKLSGLSPEDVEELAEGIAENPTNSFNSDSA